jgi:hypothetical protein
MHVLLAALLLALPARAGDAGFEALGAAFQQALLTAAAGRAAAVKAARVPRAAAPNGWQVLARGELKAGAYHTNHAKLFSKYAPGVNAQILRGIDAVQKTAMDGGGYFTGPKANPAESPIGYALSLFGHPLLAPARKTSFCTGATYSALIEALNFIYASSPLALTADRLEALRMQEPGGGRREDGVKFWGRWNADDAGADYALVQYASAGQVIAPRDARAGDFMGIDWKNGGSHSVVFLGWFNSKKEGRSMLVWSSQAVTNGLADYQVPLSRVSGVKIVRLTNPDALATFAVDGPALTKVAWDKIDWAPLRKARARRRAVASR